jgi:hypothetical protein
VNERRRESVGDFEIVGGIKPEQPYVLTPKIQYDAVKVENELSDKSRIYDDGKEGAEKIQFITSILEFWA